MNRILIVFALTLSLFLSLLVLNNCQAEAINANRLWYNKAADDSAKKISVDKARWGAKFSKEALPLGNGRLGCMPYGGVQNEFVEFNEDSLWIGNESERRHHKLPHPVG